MGYVVNELLKLGKNQIGYAEDPKGSNRTKYGNFSDTPKAKNGPYPWYNGKKNGACGWCAIGINWEYMMVLKPLLGSYDKVREYLGYPKPSENCAAGAPQMRDYLVDKFGKVAKDKGQPGDVIFVNTKLGPCGHVGRIVEDLGSKYKTIEYNKGDKVAYGSYSKTSSSIHTIVHIDFSDIEPKEEPKEDVKPTPDPEPQPVEPTPEPLPKPEPVEPVKPTKSIDEYAKEVIAGKWGNNPQRAIKMKAAGIDYDAVQKRVNEILGVGQSSSSGKQYTVDVRSDSYLNVRYGPNSEIKVGKLYRGDKVTVYEKKGNWGRIGTNRWVSMNYLK